MTFQKVIWYMYCVLHSTKDGLWVAHRHIAGYMNILSGIKAVKYFISFYFFSLDNIQLYGYNTVYLPIYSI